jgi:hypothetical protein
VLLTAILLAAGIAQAAPAYEDFPSEPTPIAAPALPDLGSHPLARRYRTVLTRAAANGPNFAGHYTLVRIGCGTSCIHVAVLDAITGQVHFPKNLEIVQWAGWWHTPYGPQYRRHSRLLVVYGSVGESQPYGVAYFLWNGHEFGRLAFIPQDRGTPPE